MYSKVLFIGPLEANQVFVDPKWLDKFGDSPLCHRATLTEALPQLSSGTVDCVVLVGIETVGELFSLLEQIQSLDRAVPVIAVSAALSAAEAVRLIKAGASNCFGPGDIAERLRDAVESAAGERRRLRRREQRLAQPLEEWRNILVGDGRAMETVAETIRLVSSRRCTVLISGETGTGKEMAARAVHMASPRARFNMVAVNCSALPENLLEAELFGHTKGAFTGATGHRIGRFEQADKGTIFLDEIGEMPFELQAKLLRVLQERELQRLGSSETVKLDVRVVAATNVDLAERVRQGKFREDLFYRLNVVPLRMPPLRERAGDIAELAAHFIKKICAVENIPLKRLTPDALDCLCGHRWPGNVRQLENFIEMAIAISGDRDVLLPADFGAEVIRSARFPFVSAAAAVPSPNSASAGILEGEGFDDAIDRFALTMLENALRESGGNKTVAAERLRMKRTTLVMKMRSLLPAGMVA
ncbi:MAG TPA: sigma-54 dependent transcriptional regulator [Bryobacteraceae bacterium]|jgi:DNA-binding NtrC family response regulator|nr:sigma-54 dependent transcriptional regulator [Bryobacteraceae bacterium]